MSTNTTATPTDIVIGAEDIDALEFSYYTAARIRRESVVHVTKSESFDTLGHSVVGGVYDTRMGAMKGGDAASVCGTCGQRHELCGGHPGHIELREWVYNPLTFNYVYLLARGMCWYCHQFYCFDSVGGHKYVLRSLYACLQCVNEHRFLQAKKYWDLYHHLKTFGVDTKPEELDSVMRRFTSNFMAHFPDPDADTSAEECPNTQGIELFRREIVHELVRELQGSSSAAAECPNCGCPKVKTVRRDDARTKLMLVAFYPDLYADGAAASQTQHERMALFKKRVAETPAEKNITYLTPARVRQQFADATEMYRAKDNGIVANILNALFNVGAKNGDSGKDDGEHIGEYYDMMFLTTLSVMPNRFRPMLAVGEVRSEHPYTGVYRNIVMLNNYLDLDDAALKDQKRTTRAEVIIAMQLLLNKLVSGLRLSSMNVTTATGISGDLITANLVGGGPSIKETLEKKQGLFRKNMMGKRVNYAARSVISPDPYLATNEIGLPLYFSTHLCYPEPVTSRNVEWLRRLVINGPNVYPGALWIEDEWGNTVRLLAHDKKQRMNEAMKLLVVENGGAGAGATAVGGGSAAVTGAANATGGARNRGYKIVYRHLKDGDMALVNRQPTLHKPGIMAHSVRVLSTERTIRMHYTNCSTYNADFDGDEMNVHIPQGELARAEARTIAFTDEQYMVPKDGSPLRGLIQDSVITGVLLTKRDTYFTRTEFQKLLYSSLFSVNTHAWIETPQPAILKPAALWTGKQLISCILHHVTLGMPPINFEGKGKVAPTLWGRGGYHSTSPIKNAPYKNAPEWFVPDIVNFWPGANENVCIVRKSELLSGVLDKAQFGASAYGLVHCCHELYGPATAGTLLTVLGRLLVVYMQQFHGFTCGMDDLLLKPEAEASRRLLLRAANEASRDVTVQVASNGALLRDTESSRNGGGATSDIVCDGLTAIRRDPAKSKGLDNSVKRAVNKIASRVIEECLPGGTIKPFPANCMQLMTGSGARGSNVNASQISCLLGQQELEGRRVPLMVTCRSLPSFRRFDTSARAGGFVMDRFLTGVRPQEFFFHCMAGREGLIDTAVKTANSGYLQRCLMKAMEGLTVAYDYTVRDTADGSVVQFAYGEDALDVCRTPFLKRFDFWLNNFDAFVERYNLRDAVAKFSDAESTASGSHDIKACSKALQECVSDPAHHDPLTSQFFPSEKLGLFSENFYGSLSSFIDEHSVSKKKSSNAEENVMLQGKKEKRKFQELIALKYSKSLVSPGEAVGVLASQSIGEPSTQMTLNTFHLAGRGDVNVTLGMPRLKELLMSAKENIATPSMTVAVRTKNGSKFASDEEDRAAATRIARLLSRLTLLDIVQDVTLTESLRTDSNNNHIRNYDICISYRPDYMKTLTEDYQIPMTRFRTLMKRFEKQLHVLVARQLHRKATDATIGITSVSREDVPHGSSEVNDETDSEVDEAKNNTSKKNRKQRANEEDDIVESESEEENDEDDAAMKDSDDDDEDDKNAKKKKDDGDDDDSDSDSDSGDADDKMAGTDAEEKEEKASGDRLQITITMGASDKVMMMQVIEECIEKTVLHEYKGIGRCFVFAADPKPTRPDLSKYVVQTEGVNFPAVLALATVLENDARSTALIDTDSVTSNDVHKVLRTYGVEAARAVLVREVGSVFKVYGINVDYRHLSLIGEYMMFDGTYRSFSRNGTGVACNASPLLQISFETAGNFLINAATFNRVDNLCTPAASIVTGLPVHTGTGAFFKVEQILDPEDLAKLRAKNTAFVAEGVPKAEVAKAEDVQEDSKHIIKKEKVKSEMMA